MLNSSDISKPLSVFLKKINKMTQEDKDKAIDNYANELGKIIVQAIKKATIVIPTGGITVQGSPAAQANIAPIVLQNVIQ